MRDGVDAVRWWFWTKVVPLELMTLVRDRWLRSPNGLRWARRALFPPRMRPYYDFFDFKMDHERASFICEYRGTARALASAFLARFPSRDITDGCSYDGEWLRHYANDYLRFASEMGQDARDL